MRHGVGLMVDADGGVASPSGVARARSIDRDDACGLCQRIDEMKKVVVLEKKPQVADAYEPFFLPAIGLLILSLLALSGLRFNPW